MRLSGSPTELHRDQGQGSSRPASASTRLRGKVELMAGSFGSACASVFTHQRIRQLLPEYLIRTHCIIRTTVPLMESVRAKASEMSDTDPVAAGVARYLSKHVEEERDHDLWLLEDLELMGVQPEVVLARVPSPTVASFVGSQYYWSLHYHPVALLGYFTFMEGFPPSPELIAELKARTGYPTDAFRTLEEHGELDLGHRDELDETIDALPLTREHEQVLGICVLSGMDLLTRSIEEVLESARVVE